MGHLHHIPRLSDHWGREGRKTLGAGRSGCLHWNSVWWTCQGCCPHGLMAAVTTCTWPVHGQARQSHTVNAGGAYGVPSLVEEVLGILCGEGWLSFLGGCSGSHTCMHAYTVRTKRTQGLNKREHMNLAGRKWWDRGGIGRLAETHMYV